MKTFDSITFEIYLCQCNWFLSDRNSTIKMHIVQFAEEKWREREQKNLLLVFSFIYTWILVHFATNYTSFCSFWFVSSCNFCAWLCAAYVCVKSKWKSNFVEILIETVCKFFKYASIAQLIQYKRQWQAPMNFQLQENPYEVQF